MSALAFRNMLEAGDVRGLRAFWQNAAPGMPQPETQEQAEIVMHMARTTADSVSFKARAYSHRWLTERNQRSQLPESLKPRAEQMFPQIADAVGISVNFHSLVLAPAAAEIERTMADAVEDAYADGRREPDFVRQRMGEARAKTERALFGRRK